MAAGPTSITICNRLMRKIGKEMSGEVRKNHYASTTPFYLSGDCLEPANQGIYWWPERESTFPNFYGLISNIYQKGNRKGNIALRESKNRSCTFFHLPLHLSWDSFSQNLLK